MENLTIKLVIANGDEEIKVSNISVSDYQQFKQLHGVSLVDDIIDHLIFTMQQEQ